MSPARPHSRPITASASHVPVTIESLPVGIAYRIPPAANAYRIAMRAPDQKITRGTSRCGFFISPPAELISSKPKVE